jgi:putative sterol carrier protein
MASLDEIFNNINARMAAGDPAKRGTNNHVYKYNITTDSGAPLRTWVMNLKDAKLTNGDGAAEVTFTVTESVMIELGSGKLTTADGIAQGKVKVDGDMSIALMLGKKE